MAERTIKLRLEIDGREVEARLRSTDALVEQLQRHLADVGPAGQQAGRTAAAGLDAIEREIRSGTIVSIRQANEALRQLDALFEEATDDDARARIAALSQEVHALRGRMMGAAIATGSGFNPATMQLVRLVQDAQYGFLSMANNLQELITQLALSARAGGGLRAALSSLVSGLIGPAGIVAALSAAVAFGPQIVDFFRRLGSGSSLSGEEVRKLREELEKLTGVEVPKDLIQAFERLAGGARGATDRIRAFAEAWRDALGDIEDTGALSALVRQLNEEVQRFEKITSATRKQIDELAQSIKDLEAERRQIMMQEFIDKRDRQGLAEISAEIERLQNRYRILSNTLAVTEEQEQRLRAAYEATRQRLLEVDATQEASNLLRSSAAALGIKLKDQIEQENRELKTQQELLKQLAELRREDAAAREEQMLKATLLPEDMPDFASMEPLLTRDEELARRTAEAHRIWQEAMQRSSEGTEMLRRSLVDAIQAEIQYRESLLATSDLSDKEVSEQQERITELRQMLASIEVEGAGAFERAAQVIGKGARVTLGEIEALIAALERYKKTLADPAQIHAVDAVIGRLNAMREAMQQGGQQAIDLSAKFSNELANALTDLAVELAEVIAHFGQTANVASNVIAVVLRTMAQFATQFGRTMIAAGTASLALRSLLVNPFAAISAGVALVAIGSTLQQLVDALAQQDRRQRYARGGLVSGPGGPEEDRIPALVSSGEYIVRAKAARQALPLLEEINRRGERLRPAHVHAAMAVLQAHEVPRFAQGGLVGRRISLEVPVLRIAGKAAPQELVVRVQGELVGRGRDLIGVIRETERIISRMGT